VGRVGACVSGCGKCCESIRLQVPPSYRSNPDVRRWVELHDIRLMEADGGVWAVVPIPCTALMADKQCALYGTPERPDVCAGWPYAPRDLTGLDDVCGYSFEGATSVPA